MWVVEVEAEAEVGDGHPELGGEDEEAAADQVLEDQAKESGTQVGQTHQQGTVCRLQRAWGILPGMNMHHIKT